MYLLKSHLTRSLTALFAAIALANTLAQAQPAPHGHGGPGGVPPLAALLLDTQVHTAMVLSAAQEAQWSALQTAEQSLRTQADVARTNLQALIAAELADPLPDLIAIENAMVANHQAMAAAAAAISTQAIALYSSLSTAQEAIVAAALQAQAVRQRSRG